jgi:hypothetical protein
MTSNADRSSKIAAQAAKCRALADDPAAPAAERAAARAQAERLAARAQGQMFEAEPMHYPPQWRGAVKDQKAWVKRRQQRAQEALTTLAQLQPKIAAMEPLLRTCIEVLKRPQDPWTDCFVDIAINSVTEFCARAKIIVGDPVQAEQDLRARDGKPVLKRTELMKREKEPRS